MEYVYIVQDENGVIKAAGTKKYHIQHWLSRNPVQIRLVKTGWTKIIRIRVRDQDIVDISENIAEYLENENIE